MKVNEQMLKHVSYCMFGASAEAEVQFGLHSLGVPLDGFFSQVAIVQSVVLWKFAETPLHTVLEPIRPHDRVIYIWKDLQ